MDYSRIYTHDYFSGKDSFFYKATGGYRDVRTYFDRLARWFSPYVQGPRILDAGCAYGFLLRRFQGRGELYGVDVSAFALEKAREILPEGKFQRVTLGMEELPFPSRYFQTVLTTDVLEHLSYEDQGKAAQEMARVLAPGGHWLITSPNFGIIRRLFYFLPDRMEHHVGMRRVDGWLSFLLPFGFELVAFWTYLHGLFPFRLLNRGGLPEMALVLRRKAG